MLHTKAPSDDFWCPLEDGADAVALKPSVELTSMEREVLLRVARGEWIPDAHVDRLEARRLVERACGKLRLTPAARATLGADTQ